MVQTLKKHCTLSKYYILVKGNKKPGKILKSLLHVCKSDTNKTNHLNVEICRCELKNKPSCCESTTSYSTFHLLSYCFKTVFVFFFFFIFLFKPNSRVFFSTISSTSFYKPLKESVCR